MATNSKREGGVPRCDGVFFADDPKMTPVFLLVLTTVCADGYDRGAALFFQYYPSL